MRLTSEAEMRTRRPNFLASINPPRRILKIICRLTRQRSASSPIVKYAGSDTSRSKVIKSLLRDFCIGSSFLEPIGGNRWVLYYCDRSQFTLGPITLQHLYSL